MSGLIIARVGRARLFVAFLPHAPRDVLSVLVHYQYSRGSVRHTVLIVALGRSRSSSGFTGDSGAEHPRLLAKPGLNQGVRSGALSLAGNRTDDETNGAPRASRLWVPYLYLAGAYVLKGDLDRARSALAESLRLKPALRSVARMRAENPWLSNPQYWELQERTLNLGLRRAGLPDQ
jgi:hypothetical protein